MNRRVFPHNPARSATRILLISLISCWAAVAQNAPAKKNHDAPRTPRVEALLQQLTLEEKIGLLHGSGEDASTYQGEAGYLAGVPRLGIPPLRLADGPPGILTRIPASAPVATMGLGATFSREDARLNGEVVARQARARGIDVILQPFINIARDFNFGRAYNTYGEDPFLTGQIGAGFIEGAQGQGVMAQAKHYIGYDTDAPDVAIDPQALREVYAAPFREAIRAGVSSIMCSYNKINGAYACGNDGTLNGILKEEMGFRGFVTSDWGAVHSAEFLGQGLDMEMPGPLPVPWSNTSYFELNPPREAEQDGVHEGPALTAGGLPEEPKHAGGGVPQGETPTADLLALVQQGKVSMERIDDAVARILTQMERFHLLGRTTAAPVTGADQPDDAAILEKTATDAVVLLKNENHALPLDGASLHNLVLIGPGAAQVVAVGLTGEKAVGLPARQVGPLESLRKLAGDAAKIAYAPGNDMDGNPVPADRFTHFGKPGLERRVFKEDAVRVDASIDFTQKRGNALAPDQSIVWTGTFTAPEDGSYRLHLQILGCWAKLKIDDQVVASTWYNWIHGEVVQAGQDNLLPTSDGLDNLRAVMNLKAGPHRIRIEANPDSSHQPMQVRFNWVTPSAQAENHRAAIEAARSAHTAIVFAWARHSPIFALPGDQDQWIAEIAAVNPNTIVVLNTSQPIAMPWIDKVRAVVQMWWSGDEGGRATARILLGQANPAGRLPFSWPMRAEDMPAGDAAHPERQNSGIDGKIQYGEGIFLGYRWLDQRHIQPRFPFGFGLSYTQFAYRDLRIVAGPEGSQEVRFQLKNVGAVAGDEVPQVYLRAPQNPPAGAQFAERILVGFERIHLLPGESREVSVRIPAERFRYWSVARQDWAVVPGQRVLDVGASERDLRLHAAFVQ